VKPKWPTLEGRLSQSLVEDKDEIKLLEQLDISCGLNKLGKDRLEKLRKKVELKNKKI
jgi:hypothetical protein